MRFDIGDEVYILYRGTNQRAGWDGIMDQTIGQLGVIIDVNEDDDNYQITFDHLNKTYYYNEEVVGDYDDMQEILINGPPEKKIKNVWAIARISGEVFKLVGKDESGFYDIFCNKSGETISNQYFELKSAPLGCKSFDWVAPQPKE